MTLTAQQLRSALILAGVPPLAIAEPSDAVYMPPAADWLKDFHLWFLSTLEAFGVRDYKAESGDCDDFADLFSAFARITHRRTSPDAGAALPIGRFNFSRIPGAPDGREERHAINWVFTRNQGLVFVEPQVLFRIERLAPNQIQSCTRCSD